MVVIKYYSQNKKNKTHFWTIRVLTLQTDICFNNKTRMATFLKRSSKEQMIRGMLTIILAANTIEYHIISKLNPRLKIHDEKAIISCKKCM